ncbi:MFS DHA1 protein [Gloeophyllum trabeum ATCC 11539]|uniref:MFS DHA1 protein n=1 Tax=Gloeophyllum trabeum (strain ATCC 11539 / FP-39264 / Madison 617) TaxID=670483 RepID=S7Q0C7_GLOTA|nr:MFS DHA1 protein [Gloeophyllum trabeum ATCC 11539]EPQ52972.1 MFS DHA1 protein [Gloeophyllum trabeum ATCC 11539]
MSDNLPQERKPLRKLDFGFLPIPPYLRHNPDAPFELSIPHTVIFGFASTFSMNLYYCQPILVQLADEFNVDYVEVSRIPSLLQAGYAVGLTLLSPLGDLIRRRQFLFLLMIASASLSIGLAITRSLVAFETISFFVAVFSVTPQILIPLTAELAPPQRRASSIAIVLSGLLMGVMLARVLSGIIAEFSSYKNIYWMGVGGQYLLLLVLYFVCPDTPPKNPQLTYLQILYTMAKFAVTEPLLVQGAILFFADSAIYSAFWVTLTFLLSDAPYHYNTLEIGLFGLVGMFGIAMAPLVGRAIDRLLPWTATLFSIILIIVSMAIQTAAGGINIGAVIVAIFVLDVGAEGLQVSVTNVVFGINPEARARLNAVLILSIFLGQVMGTAVGTRVFVEGGYRATGGFCVALGALNLAVHLLRGPHVPARAWLGWAGGWSLTKTAAEERQEKAIEMAEMPSTSPQHGTAEVGGDGGHARMSWVVRKASSVFGGKEKRGLEGVQEGGEDKA